MKRSIHLRQIEALKAVIETGTVSQAAEALLISQPAVSKLLAHLENDTELQLFDRVRGRLVPSAHGLRLYQEVERIFAGVKQIERAVDLIKRAERGQISIGVLPAFSGLFISRVTGHFLKLHGGAHVSITGRSSQFIVDWLLSKQTDVGIINSVIEHPLIKAEPLGAGNLVCIVPLDHPLAERAEITPQDIAGEPFISFSSENRTRQKIDAVLSEAGVTPNSIIDANLAQAVSEMVADGMGISILDPLFAYSQRDRLAIRPFKPDIQSDLKLCTLQGAAGQRLVDAYLEATRFTAATMLARMGLTASF
ncbi:LysR substrate-binding domain-containing protein [Aureimonas fodinaquatilis]|nr:LysR substrate-binding domain-containing protein [Aureimonas fodinaquatilis]